MDPKPLLNKMHLEKFPGELQLLVHPRKQMRAIEEADEAARLRGHVGGVALRAELGHDVSVDVIEHLLDHVAQPRPVDPVVGVEDPVEVLEQASHRR